MPPCVPVDGMEAGASTRAAGPQAPPSPHGRDGRPAARRPACRAWARIRSAGGRRAAMLHMLRRLSRALPATNKIRGAGWNTVRCGQHVIKLHPKLLIQDRPQEATRPRPVAMCQPGRHSRGAGAGHGSFCTRRRHTRPGRWFRLAVIRGSPGGWRRLSPCRTVGSREPPRRRASRSRPPGDPRAGSGTTRAARPGGSFGGRHATPSPRAVSSPSGASLSISRGADRGSASRHPAGVDSAATRSCLVTASS